MILLISGGRILCFILMDFIRSKIDYNFEIRWPFEWTRILDISIFSDVHSLKAKKKGLEPFASNCFLFGSSTSEFLFYNSYFEVKVNGEFSLFQKTSKEPFSFIYDVTFIFCYEAPQKMSHCRDNIFCRLLSVQIFKLFFDIFFFFGYCENFTYLDWCKPLHWWIILWCYIFSFYFQITK